MKVHSYLAYNGALSEKYILWRRSVIELDKAIEAAGGWSKTLYGASQEAISRESNGSPLSNGGEYTPSIANLGGTELHRRRKNSTSKIPPVSEDQHVLVDNEDPKDPRRLVDYSDETISNLANDCVDLQEELTSGGTETIMWPANVTFGNYIDYLLIPTLVYELTYPRTATIRPFYVLEKALATFGTFFIIYAITEHIIIPTHEASKGNPMTSNNFLAAALDQVLPFMINYLLIFYIIFECICNAFAELTRFADRGFYEDWWNAVTWDEFARKWNKPVHQVCFRL